MPAAAVSQSLTRTDNQSLVEASSLHATDKLQRDIEDVLERHDWYYERRKNYYRNIGKPAARFVTPLYLAAGYVALVMKNPAVASRLKARFMRTPQGYSSVFGEAVPLAVWVTITEVLKRVEAALSQVRPTHVGESERFLAKWRSLVALLTVARLLGRFSYGINDLTAMDVQTVTPQTVIEMWRLVESERRTPTKEREFRSRPFVEGCCRVAARSYGIADPDAVGRRQPAAGPPKIRPAPSEDLILKVDNLLPGQPWKPGVHAAVAAELGCNPRLVSAAIEELMRRGTRLRQKDGVVYDAAGQIVAVDTERLKNRDPGDSD